MPILIEEILLYADLKSSIFTLARALTHKVDFSFMGDGPRGIEVFSDHFQASTSGVDTSERKSSPVSHPRPDYEVHTLCPQPAS